MKLIFLNICNNSLFSSKPKQNFKFIASALVVYIMLFIVLFQFLFQFVSWNHDSEKYCLFYYRLHGEHMPVGPLHTKPLGIHLFIQTCYGQVYISLCMSYILDSIMWNLQNKHSHRYVLCNIFETSTFCLDNLPRLFALFYF